METELPVTADPKFYTERFTDELKPAYQKWLALKPLENPAAPPHPFVPELYTLPFTEENRAANAEAARAEAQSNTAGHTASTYLSNTILLATVLFFAGTAGRFDRRHVRWFSREPDPSRDIEAKALIVESIQPCRE